MATLPLNGQTAIVTGGSRGIGLGIAQQLAREGARIIIWDRDPLALDARIAGFTPLLQQRVDVSDHAAVVAAVDAAIAAAGKFEILVNNAGVNGPVVDTWEYPLDAWDKVIAVDLTGVFYCCRAAVPHLRSNRYGRIVTISSIAGKEGMPGIAAYSAAKAGVIGFSKALARELVKDGITVNCIAPVITQTELFKEMTQEHIDGARARIPMGRFCSVEEIAAMTGWVVSPACSFTTGQVFDVSGGRATY